MIKEKIGKHEILLYDSISELPSDRFMEFNRYLLIDSGIGGDMEAVDTRLQNLYNYIAADKKDLAATEIENLRSSLFFVIEKVNPKFMAYICLVESIDNVKLTDLSETNIKATLSLFSEWGIRKGFIYKAVDAFKKKNQEEIETFFPDHFDIGVTVQAHEDLLERAQMLLSQIAYNEDHSAKLKENDELFMEFAKPRTFTGKKSAELEYIKKYESTCILIQDNLHRDAKKMTVMEYYEALSYLKIKFKPKPKTKAHRH